MTKRYNHEIWGWIPSIEGNAYDEEYIRDVLSEETEEVVSGYGAYSYTYDSSESVIIVSNEYGLCKIKFVKETGLCSIAMEEIKKTEQREKWFQWLMSSKSLAKDMADGTDQAYENWDTIVWIEGAWEGLRKKMDGCIGTVCDCTAMRPVYVSSEAVLSEELILNKIAERFIRTVEHETDCAIGILGHKPKRKIRTPRQWKKLFNRSMYLLNITKSNQLYLKRFLDIVGDRFSFSPEAIEYYGSIMDARCEKARISYDSNMRESEYRYKSISSWMTCGALFISVLLLFLTHVLPRI